MNRNTHALLIALLFTVLSAGCAAGPFPTPTSPGGTAPRYLTFHVQINSTATFSHSGNGYVIILFNANGEPIEVTSIGTFTDFIRYDGTNFTWFHRQGAVPSPGYTFVPAGTVNQFATIAADDKSFDIRFNVNDTSTLLSQYIVAPTFTTHVLTTDSFNAAYIGRVLDTLGQGPSITNNPTFTMTVNKQTGIVPPIPAGYPNDPLNDWIIQPGLAGDYPYASFDLENFQITSSN
jgi:hypothetical protein